MDRVMIPSEVNMNYFEQITASSEDNALILLGGGDTTSATTKRAIFKRNVEIINLELSYQCNRKCDYCPVATSSRSGKQEFMSAELLEKIGIELAEIRYENRLSLNLYNEPLLDDELEDKIALIRSRLPYSHIAFNSNGDRLTMKRLKTLSDAGCDAICVTLHPPPYKVQTLQTIQRRVSKFLEKLSTSAAPEIDFESRIHLQFRSLGVSIKLQWPDWRNEGTNRAGILTDHASGKFIRTQPCAKPFREFTVFYDGFVQPCCEAFHDKDVNLAPMGDLNRESVFDVYVSDLLTNFRRHVFDFGPKKGMCKSCAVTDYSKLSEDAYRKDLLSRVNGYQKASLGK